MRELGLIVAVGQNGVIGKDGDLPWRFSEDLKHFKRTTSGHAVIMGRKTWESIGRPLPKRRNLVITRQAGYAAEGAEVFGSLDEALEAAWADDTRPFVIGGGGVYAEALPKVTHAFITEVALAPEGDAFFSPLPPEFVEVARRAGDAPELSFVEYRRDARSRF